MNYLLIKEDQVIWLGLIVSLLIHGILFVFSGRTFIQHAQYSVQTSLQTVEVSIEEIKYSGGILEKTNQAQIKKEEVRKSQAKPLQVLPKLYEVKGTGNIYFQNPPPEYPELAKQMRQEGLVILSVDVNRAGDPVKVEIMQSSGYRLLDQAAYKAVSHWKFQPGRMGDIQVGSRVTVPIRFRLEK